MRFSDEKEIWALLYSFETATIARTEWKHAEHLVVALCYLERYELEEATAAMRKGLFNLLKNGFGVDLSKEMPYHETLTIFWMRAVADFRSSRTGRRLLEMANELVEIYAKDLPLRSYSRELLFSDDARSRYVEPDLEYVDSVR